MATDWSKMQKVSRLATLEMGNSQVSRLIPRDSNAGVALGFSEIGPGSMDVEVTKAEIFLVLEGRLEVSLGDQTIDIAESELAWLPGGTTVTLRTRAACRVVYIILED